MKVWILALVLLLQSPLDLATTIKGSAEKLVTALTPSSDFYTAVSDTRIRPKPTPPTLGPAGSAFLDPTFGSRMWRVTDTNTSAGSSLRVASSAHAAVWNSNGSMFFVMNEGGGSIFFAFDPQAGPTKLPVTVASQIEPSFSYVDLATVYGAVIHRIRKWNIVTTTVADVLDLDTLGLSLGSDTYIGGFQNVDADVLVTFFGGTSQDRHVFVYHSKAGLLDLRSKNWKIHAVSMDRTGRYVFIYPANDPNLGHLAPGVAQVQIWDTQTGALTPVTNLPAGHDSAGYGVWVNADCCSGGTWDASQWQIRLLTNLNSPTNLIPSVLTPQEIYLGEHSNWRAARADIKVPIISASYRYGAGVSQTDYPWRPWDEEIIAVATDGSGKVQRFAHHQSIVGVVPDFWSEPIVDTTPDGHMAVFTSNWGVLGGRQDVFAVELK